MSGQMTGAKHGQVQVVQERYGPADWDDEAGHSSAKLGPWPAPLQFQVPQQTIDPVSPFLAFSFTLHY